MPPETAGAPLLQRRPPRRGSGGVPAWGPADPRPLRQSAVLREPGVSRDAPRRGPGKLGPALDVAQSEDLSPLPGDQLDAVAGRRGSPAVPAALERGPCRVGVDLLGAAAPGRSGDVRRTSDRPRLG